MRQLINVSNAAALKQAGVPYTRESLYQMHYKKEHPELFVKLARYLMLDLDAWNAHVEKIIEKRDAKIHKMKLH